MDEVEWTAPAAVTAIIGNHLAPVLKRVGFRRRATRWWRRLTDTIQVVEIQRNKYNTKREAQFTLNLGVYVPRLVELVREVDRMNFLQPATEFPIESSCMLRDNLDCLIDRPEWWIVRRPEDAPQVAASVLDAWQTSGWPWLNELSEPEHFRRELRDRAARGDWMAAVYWVGAAIDQADTDDGNAALEMVTKASHMRGPEREQFRRWAAAHGLT